MFIQMINVILPYLMLTKSFVLFIICLLCCSYGRIF